MDNSIFIKDEELKQLDSIIGQMPTMYGLPLVQFFQLVRQKRAVEKQAEGQDVSVPNTDPSVN